MRFLLLLACLLALLAKAVDAAAALPTIGQSLRISSISTPNETWDDLEEAGDVMTKWCDQSLVARGIAAGCFVGLGGILTCSVGFDMGNLPWLPGNGMARFMTGAVGFPLSIILASMTGQGAWTGDIALVARAFIQDPSMKRVVAALRFSTITWIAAFLGTYMMALLTTLSGLPACAPCIEVALHKLSFTWSQAFFRGVGGGGLICLAVFMQRMNRDMAGKVLSIWFPISTYVICDFEHVLASMFFLTCAKMNGADFTWQRLLQYLVPSTLGNVVGGALMVGVGLSSIPQKLHKDHQ